MADTKKRITELPTSTTTTGLYTLGVDSQNEGVKIPIGNLIGDLSTSIQNAQGTADKAKTD